MTQPAYKRRPLWLTAHRLEVMRAVAEGRVRQFGRNAVPPVDAPKVADPHLSYFLLDRGADAPWPPSRWITVTAAMNFLYKNDAVQSVGDLHIRPWELTEAGKQILLQQELARIGSSRKERA